MTIDDNLWGVLPKKAKSAIYVQPLSRHFSNTAFTLPTQTDIRQS